MGRKPKWTPSSVGFTKIKATHANAKIIKDYLAFCEHQRVAPGSRAVIRFAESLNAAGLDPSTIANRIDMVRRVRRDNAEEILAGLEVTALMTKLRQNKVRAGGPKRKPLIDYDTLITFLNKSVPTLSASANEVFQIIWFILMTTGARPNETHTMRVRRGTRGLEVQFNGRKRHAASSAIYYVWPTEWSGALPQHLERVWDKHVKNGHPPKIGTQKSIASHINSWLKRAGANFTSTAPRVRMDNLLRELVEDEEITATELEDRMGHTWQVSTNSYARSGEPE